MADDVVKTITIKGTTQGVDETTASVIKLGDAMADVTEISDTSTKSTVSVQNALDRQQRSLDSTYRAQIQYNASQRVINDAVNQGLITQDRANQLLDLASARFDKATGSAGPFAKAVQGVQTQLVAMAAGAGPVGVLLASFGPLGLAAAAGIGVISAAIDYMIAESNRMGDVARQVRDLASTVQLSTTNFQVLQSAGTAVGLTTEDVSRSFERFAVGLGSLRDGTGDLYTQLQKVNPALVLQLATTKDNATAWNLLAQAYSQADAQQQALIAHAAFGRGGAATGRLLTATANAGGIQGLDQPANTLTQEQVDKWSTLKTQIDQTNKIAKDLMASLFTQEVLDRELKFQQGLLAAAQTAKELSQAGGLTGLGLIGGGGGDIGYSPSTSGTPPAAAQARVPSFDQRFGSLPAATPNAEFQSNQMKATIAALGTAASAWEQNRAKVLELDSALEKHTITQTTYNRAVAGLNLGTVIQLESQRIALLGQGSTVMDLVKQKEDEITAARIKGVNITQQEATGILAYVAAQKLASDTALLTTNNVVTAEQLRITKLAELNAAILQGKLTQDQATISLQAYEKVIEQTIQQQQIQRSALTNTATLAVQTTSLRNQLDTFSTDTSNNIGTAFVNIATGASTAKVAFANLEQQVVKSLISMAVQMAIVKPIAQGLNAILGGFLPGGNNPGTPGGVGPIDLTKSANGNVFDSGRVMLHPFALGGILSDIVTKPTLFPMASGGIGSMGEGGNPEAIMPLARGANGKLGVSGGGVQVNVNVINQNGSSIGVQQSKDDSGNVNLQFVVRDAVNKNIAAGQHDAALRGRFGMRPNKVRAG